MIKTVIKFFILSCFCTGSVQSFAQAKFAGNFKSLIGKRYKKEPKKFKELAGYEFKEGSLVSEANDPDALLVDVYQKGTTAVVFFSKQEAGDSLYTIPDVLEIKAIPKGWQVRTTFCSEGANADVGIVAVVKETTEEVMKGTKQAWRFDRDKLRFEKIDPKRVTCISEGGD
jgi:hypothetical protein